MRRLWKREYWAFVLRWIWWLYFWALSVAIACAIASATSPRPEGTTLDILAFIGGMGSIGMAIIALVFSRHNRPRSKSIFKKNVEVILSASIEYQNEAKYIAGDSDVGQTSFDKLDSAARTILCKDLPADLATIYGLKTDIRYIATRQGSLVIFFGVMLTTYGLITNYKAFSESIDLIRKHAKRLLQPLQRQLHTPPLHVHVEEEHSGLPAAARRKGLEEMNGGRVLFRKPIHRMDKYSMTHAFVWYLIVTNFILFIALGALVTALLVRLYF